MLRRSSRDHVARPVPMADLVRRAFRSGSLIPLLVLALIIAIRVPIAQIDSQAARGQDFAAVLQGIISDRTAIFIGKAESVARLLATSDDEVTTQSRVEQLTVLDPWIESAVYANEFGFVSSVSSQIEPLAEGIDPEAQSWIAENQTPFVGTPGFDPRLPEQVVIMAVPVLSPTGGQRGILQIHVSTEWLIGAIRRTNADLEVNMYVTNGDGVVVAHADNWRVLAAQEMGSPVSGLGVGLDGQRVIAGVAPVPDWSGDLRVVTTWPAAVIIPGMALGMIPLLVVLAAYFATLVARRRLITSVITPILELESALDSFGPEDLDVRVGTTGVEEINAIAVTFNGTADRIDSLVHSLRESDAKFRAIFNNSPVGMALHQIDGAYLDTNRVYDEMFGYSGEGFTLDQILKMVLPESREATLNAFQEISSGEVDSVTFEGGFTSPEGKVVYALVQLTMLPKRGSEVDQVVGQVIDVTELKETQRRLEELLSTKNQFLAAVSHELRTPLTAVIGLAELLRDPEHALNEEQRSDLITTIVDSGFDVSNMVEDLLTAARQEAGQLTVVEVPVNLVAQTKQALEVIHAEKEIVVGGEAPTALADPGRVRQILRNLLTNALKYGGESVRVDIDTHDGFARATVSDDGAGVPPEAEELIFRSYERAHGQESHPGSVGIGLNISRELARQMGGDLKYTRQDGRTRFEVTLPLQN